MTIRWGNWDVRIEAARSWISLASRFAAENPLIIDQLEEILSDPVAAVRLQVAHNLQVIGIAAPDRMWAIGERIAAHEPNTEVLASYLNTPLNHFSHVDPERCEAILNIVKGRFDEGLTSDELQESLGGWTAHLFVGQGRTLPHTWLEEWAADPKRNVGTLTYFLSSIRAALFDRYTSDTESEALKICDRAQAGISLVLESASAISANAYLTLTSDALETEKEEARNLYAGVERVINHATNQLYFGSGANAGNRDGGPGLPSPDAMSRFLIDYADILALLATSREPATLHYLIELYGFLIPGNPTKVFNAVYDILLGRGKDEGYHYEILGNSAVVRILQRFIADHRATFDDEILRERLTGILQLFSEVGWADAMKLLYDLPELLR